MNIGEAARAAGVSAKTIRYYETAGLITTAERSGGGYRVYTQADVHVLSFIKRARDLGFSMDQITALLALWREPGRAGADVKKLAQAHIAELEEHATQLMAMSRTLRHLADHCHGDRRPECPILDDHAEGGTAARRGWLRALAHR